MFLRVDSLKRPRMYWQHSESTCVEIERVEMLSLQSQKLKVCQIIVASNWQDLVAKSGVELLYGNTLNLWLKDSFLFNLSRPMTF